MSKLFSFFSQFLTKEDDIENVVEEKEALSEKDGVNYQNGVFDEEKDEKWKGEYKFLLRQYKEETVAQLMKYIADRFCTEADDENDSYTDASTSSDECDDSETRNDGAVESNNAFASVLNGGTLGNNASSESFPDQDFSPDIMTAFETQDFRHIDHAASSSPASIPKKASKKRKRVVRIQDARNECTDIDSVDQNTKTLTLAMCKVGGYWELRNPKRIYPEIKLEAKIISSNFLEDQREKLFSLFQHRSWEEDGPFQWLYKNVLSFEVMCLESHNLSSQNPDSKGIDETNIRQLVLNTFGTKHQEEDAENSRPGDPRVSRKCHRIRIFLYDNYALKFDKLLKTIPNGHESLIALSRIPARCIFPYDPIPSEKLLLSSVSQQILRNSFGKLSKYCICIGGKSRIKLETPTSSQNAEYDNEKVNDKEETTKSNELRFDDEHFEIRLWTYDPKAVKDNQQLETFLSLRGHISKNSRESEYNNTIENKTLKEVDNILTSERNGKRLKIAIDYKTLASVKEIAMKKSSEDVYVFGVVLGFSCVSRTKNGKFMMSITLIDNSLLSKPDIMQHNDQNVRDSNNKATGPNYGKTSKLSFHESNSIPHVTLLIFTEDIRKIPNISRAGDILQIHRVKVQTWKTNVVQLVGNKWSSFTVYRPNNPTENESIPYDWHYASTKLSDWKVIPGEGSDKTITDENFKYIYELWQWAQERMMTFPTINQEAKFTISTLPNYGDEYEHEVNKPIFQNHTEISGDLTIMITDIIPAPKEASLSHFSPQGFLRVWDGTGRPSSDPFPIDSGTKHCKPNDPPAETLLQIETIVNKFNQSRKEEAFEPPKKLSGRVTNVAVWELSSWNLIDKLQTEGSIGVGKFIRLRNVNEGCLPNSRIRALMLHGKSSFTPLPDYTFEVWDLLKHHNERISRKEPYNKNSGVLPLRPNERLHTPNENSSRPVALNEDRNHNQCIPSDIPISPLSKCLSGSHCGPYTVKVKFERVFPEINTNEITANALSSLCAGDPGAFVFQFALRIRDTSAELDAIVSNDIAQNLLGMTATEVKSNQNKSHTCPEYCRAINRIKHLVSGDETFLCKVRSIIVSGSKYFVFDSINFVHLENTR